MKKSDNLGSGAKTKVLTGMPRLPLQKQDIVALLQRTLVNKWKAGHVAQAQKEAEHVVEQWSRGRDPQADWECTSVWGEVDTNVLNPLEAFHDAAVRAFAAACPKVSGGSLTFLHGQQPQGLL